MATLDNFVARLEIQAQLGLASDLSKTISKLDGFTRALSLANGTGNNQGNMIWHDKRNILASANDDLDFSGTLVDPFGTSLVMTALKALFVVNISLLVATTVKVGGTVINSIADWNVDIGKGGFFAMILPGAGLTVTAGTADLVRLTNNDGANAADVEVIAVGLG